MRCLVKFCSRRGLPQTIYSDNATNFSAASKTMKSIIGGEEILAYSNSKNIEWKFITPIVPWHGGFWERLIGLTKQSLKKVVGKSFLYANDL